MAGNYEHGESSGTKNDQDSDIPAGFRFCPDDKDVMQYLRNKLNGSLHNFSHIPELDIYSFSPMDLAENQKLDEEESEMYFFTRRSKKYPNGYRPERVAKGGYWKPTSSGNDVKDDCGRTIGFARTLKFFEGSEKTESKKATRWLMREYTPENIKQTFYEWVAVKIYSKRGSTKKTNDAKEVEEFIELGSSASHGQLSDQQFQFDAQYHPQMLDEAHPDFLTSVEIVESAGQYVSTECQFNNLSYTNHNPNPSFSHSPNPSFALPEFQHVLMDSSSHMNENPNFACSELLDQTQQLCGPTAEAWSFYSDLGEINMHPSYDDLFTNTFDDFNVQVNQAQLPVLEEVPTENSDQTQSKNEEGDTCWIEIMKDIFNADKTDSSDSL